jgi:hypothetical protein
MGRRVFRAQLVFRDHRAILDSRAFRVFRAFEGIRGIRVTKDTRETKGLRVRLE